MTSYRCSDSAVSETIDGESIVIDLVSGTYYSFTGWTAWAWQSLCDGLDSDALAAAFVDVGGSDEFVERLLAGGLLAERGDVPVDRQVPPPAGPVEPLLIESFDDMADMIRLDPVHDVDPAAGWPRPHDT